MAGEQLLAILKADQETRRYWAMQPPRSCPNDGTVLEDGPDGSLFCRFDGWAYPRDWRQPQI